MTLFCQTSACLLLLLAACACRCAPAALNKDAACAEVKSNSLRLIQIAKNASLQARNGSKEVSNFQNFSFDWMQAKDQCDPETLSHNPAPCVEKIFKVLSSYKSALHKVAGFKSCSESVSGVKSSLESLHTSMSTCIQLKEDISKDLKRRPNDTWDEELLCHYTLDRLFSFSILTARVFAVGHPAAHAQGSAHKCTEGAANAL